MRSASDKLKIGELIIKWRIPSMQGKDSVVVPRAQKGKVA